MTFTRVDLVVAAALALATALSRVPFVTTVLFAWDSVLYARALEQGFHVSDVLALSRPHPPGYLFYFGMAAAARALGLGPNAALVAVSVLASGAGAAAMYLVCLRLAGRTPAVLVTLGLVTSPLFWLYGEVAMPYALLVPLSALLALLFLSARGQAPRTVVVASAIFGLAAGIRQDLLIFLGPLWLWSLAPASWRARIASLAAAAVASLAWAVPSAILSDGPIAYVESTRRQFTSLSATTTLGSASIGANFAVVGLALGWGLLLFGPILLALVLARGLALVRGSRVYPMERGVRTFFLLWLLPPFLFYAFVHVGDWGQLLSVVPPLYALTAVLVRAALDTARPAARVATAGVLLGAAAVSAGLFAAGRDPIFSADALGGHDRATAEKIAYIRSHHPPETTVVAAGAELLVAGHYLTGYRVWFSDDRAAGTYERRLDRETTVVFYEDRARPRAPEPAAAERIGNGLAVMRLPAGSTLQLNGREVDPGPR